MATTTEIEIEIAGVTYTVNLNKAIKSGLIKKKINTRPIIIKDIPNGSIFRELGEDGEEFVMLNNKLNNKNQMIIIKSPVGEVGQRSFFTLDCLYNFEVWDPTKKVWITEIEE